jgi:hypothetical protein
VSHFSSPPSPLCHDLLLLDQLHLVACSWATPSLLQTLSKPVYLSTCFAFIFGRGTPPTQQSDQNRLNGALSLNFEHLGGRKMNILDIEINKSLIFIIQKAMLDPFLQIRLKHSSVPALFHDFHSSI